MIGKYGHTLAPNGDLVEQFKIIAEGTESCAVQFYGWMTGQPTRTDTLSKTMLRSGAVRLYDTHQAWREAGDAPDDDGPVAA